jgi:hypothetical protein
MNEYGAGPKRRLLAAAFLLVLAAGCGHEVTPPSLEGDLAGHIQVKFGVNGQLDFANVSYMIAIDTCGSGVPYPQAFATSYNSYTFAFLIGGGYGNTALPELLQYYVNPDSNGSFVAFPVDNLNYSTTQFVPNYNGQSSEFEFTFLRSDLDNPEHVLFPCPNSKRAPSPAPTIFPYLRTWTFNLITLGPSRTPLDSLGYYGATDDTFPGIVVDTTSRVSPAVFRPTPRTIPSSQAAYITYGEVDNYR